jgi:surfactin family lipopeptide synthetase A
MDMPMEHSQQARHLESILLANPAVRDCAALLRQTVSGNSECVAYIVPAGPIVPERLREHVRSAEPSALEPQHFVPVFSIPRDVDGRVDAVALAAIEVIDTDLLARWEESLHSNGVEHAAVVARPVQDRLPSLHLSDLLADWKPGIEDGLTESQADNVRRQPLAPHREYTQMAIADGGPLTIPSDAPRTFTEALIRTAAACNGKGVTYIQADGTEVVQSYAQLLEDAKCVLSGLQESGLKPRDRVILQIESLKDHFTTFWACVLGGITPVTVAVAPSYNEANGVVNKLYNTWKLLEQPVIIASEHLIQPISGVSKFLPMAGLKTLSSGQLKKSTPSSDIYPSKPEDLVFFQLTSGSTGIPKCIQETHRGIISHIHGAQQFNGYSTEDVDLNWLPVDHVVPILTCHLKNTYLGCHQVQIKTELVLTKPLKWLDYLESHNATHTWSPNFGFKLVCDALAKAADRTWDLSRMKFFMNAGEQVTLPVVRNFLNGLAPFGVKQNAMQPAFGMAEVCTCMTYQNTFDVESGVHRVSKTALSGPLKRAISDADCISFVDLGPPVPGVAIRITDSENRMVEEGIIGRFQIKGDVVTPGYLNNDAANKEAFVGEGWFNSGDLGFILNGRLTLTGREKEMIIIRGANFYCYEIEDVVNRIEGAEPTFTAACAVADPSTGTEGLAIFFVPKSHAVGLADLVRTVRARVTAEMGIAPAFVIPLAKKDFPKTTSGKIQRSYLKKTLEGGGFKDVLKDLDIKLETANTLPDWFFKRHWRKQEPASVNRSKTSHRCLIFGDDLGLAARTSTELKAEGHACILVDAGTSFAQINPGHFRIDPRNGAHYRELLEALAKQHALPDRVLHFWTYTPFVQIHGAHEFSAAQDRGTYSVLFLAQAMAHTLGPKHPARFLVVSNHTQSVLPTDAVACEKTPLLGLVRTLSQEMPWLDASHMDVSAQDNAAAAARVICELNAVRLEPEVAWRAASRFVPRLERAALEKSAKKPLPFKSGGRYVITGGLGGIGTEVARFLLTRFAANVLLVGRTQLPERNKWDSMRGQSDTISSRIQELTELEKLPGRVDYAALDISNPSTLRSCIREAETRWGGKVDGVIHLAGVFKETMLVEESRESFAAALQPKALGALAIAEVLNDRPNCLYVLFSSVNSIFGGATVGAYTAANSFIDGFSLARRTSHPTTTYCLAWSPWDDTGMSRGYALKDVSRARGYYFITPRQGIDSMLAALQSDATQLVIGLDAANDSMRQRITAPDVRARRLVACIEKGSVSENIAGLNVEDRFGTQTKCVIESVDTLPRNPAGEVDQERLAAGPVGHHAKSAEPRTEVERRIAAIWKEALGVSHVGIEDSFFALGGHSLLAAQILFRLQEEFKVELSLRDLFDAPTIQGLSSRIDKAEKGTESAAWPQIVPNREKQFEPFKLTEIQQAYWVGRTGAFELGNVGCHVYTEAEFNELDIPRFNRALNRLIQRHPMLRSVVRPDGTQCVLKEVPAYEVTVNDLRGVSTENATAQLDATRAEMSHQVLDTSRAPLLEIRASQLKDRVRLHISIDLLISDARSFQILIDDMSQLYENPEKPLPELDLTFRDYIEASEKLQDRETHTRARAYWQKRLETLPPAPDLPLAINAETLRTSQFVRRQVRLEPQLWKLLKERAAKAGLTPAGILMGVYAEILGVWSKRPRFSLNLTLFNRLPLHQQVNEIVGDFTSVTLLEVERDAKPSFEERCRRMQEQLWDDLNHRYFSGVQVMREMARVQSGMPATSMPVVFTSILDLPTSQDQVPSLLKRAEFVYGITQTPQVWLDNQVYEDGETLVCNWDAVEALFPSGLLDDMFAAYERMLRGLAADEIAWTAKFSEVVKNSIPATQAQRCNEINNTDAPVTNELLHTLFAAQAAENPEKIALIAGAQEFSYKDLDARSNQLAWQLRQAGAKPNTLIAIVCEKGWEQIVSALSILKSGAAYLPIDPDVPAERLKYLLEHAEVRLALTTTKLAERQDWPGNVWRICVDDPAAVMARTAALQPVQKPEDLAYVIYTSGSTGNPKGVVIDHRGAVNTILDINSRFNVGREDKVFGISQLTFDLSVYDVFGIFAAGGTLVLPEAGRTRDPMYWTELVEQHGITIWNSVPALMNVMLDQAGERHKLDSLRVVMLSGDWIPVALPDRIRAKSPHAQVFSLGGATEASIWSIIYPIEKVDPSWKSIPYGKPMLNQRFFVLNEKLAPCPAWVPGNLYIGGIGLAKGYWRDEEKTRASFITHPQTGERLYRTGDLGRYMPDGNIEFLGREDFQVKVNGFRIELGEIETVLEKHSAVRTAVVAAVGKGDNRRLVAYIVPQKDQSVDAEMLRSYLKQKLPDYMIPPSYVAMESLPLTSNGKVDRRALPDADAPKISRKSEYLAPRTAVEEVLAGIVGEILNIERVGVFDNFFELGGNSLLVIQIVSRIRDIFDVEISAAALFESSTVASLAEHMLRDPVQREKIERSAEVLLSVADVPESDVDAWLSQSSYI